MELKQRKFGKRQTGQGMTEYIIIVALIAIAAITAVTFFGGTIRAQMGGMAQELAGDSTQAQTSINRAGNTANQVKEEGEATKGMKAYTNAEANN